jgi:two-component system, LytTR family, response regulator
MVIAIIDDDSNIRDLYKSIINKNFDTVTEILEARSVKTGIDLLKTNKPDIVILDIDLSDGTGFDLLQEIKDFDFSLIFSTAFNEFAIKAIKFSALDYILKPIDSQEFCGAITKAIEFREKSLFENKIKVFFNNFSQVNQNKKIVLKSQNEYNIISLKDIIYCKSDNSYTTFYLVNDEKHVVSKSIKEYEDLFNDLYFFRPHNSYLVNLNCIKKLDKSDGGFLILTNGKEVPVSHRKKSQLIKVLNNL